MVFSRKIAERNRVGLNRFIRHLADRIPGFGIVLHRGRRSGREFRTPLLVFRVDDGFVIALTYGPDADWVKNVLAADGCELLTRGRRYALTNPRVVRDETRRHMPKVIISQVLARADVKDFLYLDRTQR